MAGVQDVIEQSLECVAERAGDPTPAVYARLFQRYPDLEPLFARDKDNAVKGEMLAKMFEVALDLAGPNAYAANFIRCEAVNHDGVGVPREVFPHFFDIAVDTFRELAGEGWRPEYDTAWRGLIAKVEDLTAAA